MVTNHQFQRRGPPGADPDFVSVPPAMGWWLGKRAKSAFEGVPSTYQRGVLAAVE
jgi:hypothetical protein